jgi:predicted nucleic acid-binding protein
MMIVVADTSVILNLACVSQAELLPALFQEVWIPQEVEREFERLSRDQPRFHGLTLPGWVRIQKAAPVPEQLAALPNLHAGETAALALALHSHADAVLMDEAEGRRAAHALGLTVIGVLGILLQARKAGLISSVQCVISKLEADAGFWLSPSLVEQALRKAGEL